MNMDIDGLRYFAFYGSLRRGMVLHQRFREHLHYRFSARLSGYEMRVHGPYPTDQYPLPAYPVVAHGHGEITVEVTEITSADIAREIVHLELRAGYRCEAIRIDNLEVGIFLFPESPNLPLVPSGDWVQFFGHPKDTR
jgi:gamma-glutamylcyclotransferase (GGCT)/AIG2-like uncharacterized protein YtfP